MVESHYSCKSSEAVSDVFRLMFPDSHIASQFKCGETKSRYLITFGLAPYFSELLQASVKSSNDYVLLFDESLNHKAQTKQMDFFIRHWHDGIVQTRFLTSEFLGHSTAVDLEEKFASVMSEFHLNPARMLQISMDGPMVNLNLLERMNSSMMDNHNVGLLRVGSCGLHVVHNAFRRGCDATPWDIESFLSSSYTLFKDSPARREDFITITGSTSFPSKFCSHRWLENMSVARRAIEMLPDLKKFVRAAVEKRITLPKNKSFDVVKAGVLSTPLLACRLAFFSSVASLLEPLLSKYQGDQPLLLFLCNDLQDLLRSLMRKFIKDEVLRDCSTAQRLVQMDVSSAANQVSLSKVQLGFQTDRLLAEAKKHQSVTELDVMSFRAEALEFLKAVVLKLQEKSPLNFSLVRNMSCLNPKTMTEKRDLSMRKMKRILQCLCQVKRISDAACDKAYEEYSLFLDSTAVERASEMFNPATQRVDAWFHDAIADKEEFMTLWSVIKQLLLLSHGQATVERGFSCNKEVVADNLSQVALKARRVVLDHIHSVGGVGKVEIDKKLLMSASSAWGRYDRYLSDQRKQKETEDKQLERKRLGEELTALQKKAKTASDEEKRLLQLADRLSFKAQEKRSFSLIERSNDVRLSAKDKADEVERVQQDILRVKGNLKKC